LWEGGIIVFGPTDALISPEVKLILSALLLFPINFWIQFAEKKHEMGNEAEEMNGSLTGEGYLLNSAPLGGMGHQHNGMITAPRRVGAIRKSFNQKVTFD
jgi:hypothetical protein